MLPHKLMAADYAALTTNAVAGVTWLTTVSNVLQIVATCIAIASGVYALMWHRARLNELKKNRKENSDGES